MSSTTPTLLPGVDRHGKGFRVRRQYAGVRYVQTGFQTADAANAYALQLQAMHAAGQVPGAVAIEQTLGQAMEALLTRKAIGGKKGPLTARGMQHWRRSTRPWREGPLATVPLSLLQRALVEDVVLLRAATAPATARHELEGLKAGLRYAGARGQRFDLGLLAIEAIPTSRRERVALTADQLEFLAFHAPLYAQRLVLFMGTTGMRSGEVFAMTDDHVDVAGQQVYVATPKEQRPKLVPLTPEETTLVREQAGLHLAGSSKTSHLPSRAPMTRYTFPKASGKPWNSQTFRKLVWTKACARAAKAWREQESLADDQPTPFDDLTPHDLRATAATLMRDARMTRDEAAARLGHDDQGALLARVYDKGDRAARAATSLAANAPEGLRAALVGPRPASTQAVAGGEV